MRRRRASANPAKTMEVMLEGSGVDTGAAFNFIRLPGCIESEICDEADEE